MMKRLVIAAVAGSAAFRRIGRARGRVLHRRARRAAGHAVLAGLSDRHRDGSNTPPACRWTPRPSTSRSISMRRRARPMAFPEDAWIPYLPVDVTMEKVGGGYKETKVLAAMEAGDGPHYANNFAMAGPGRIQGDLRGRATLGQRLHPACRQEDGRARLVEADYARPGPSSTRARRSRANDARDRHGAAGAMRPGARTRYPAWSVLICLVALWRLCRRPQSRRMSLTPTNAAGSGRGRAQGSPLYALRNPCEGRQARRNSWSRTRTRPPTSSTRPRSRSRRSSAVAREGVVRLRELDPGAVSFHRGISFGHRAWAWWSRNRAAG